MKRLLSKKGIAMIDLIIAICIMGVLAVAGLSSTGTYVDDSRKVKAQAEVSMMEIGISQYNIDYPSAKITAINSTTINTLKTKGYIQKEPAFNGTDGCTYSFETINGSTQKHVVLKGCKFSDKNISVY